MARIMPRTIFSWSASPRDKSSKLIETGTIGSLQGIHRQAGLIARKLCMSRDIYRSIFELFDRP